MSKVSPKGKASRKTKKNKRKREKKKEKRKEKEKLKESWCPADLAGLFKDSKVYSESS